MVRKSQECAESCSWSASHGDRPPTACTASSTSSSAMRESFFLRSELQSKLSSTDFALVAAPERVRNRSRIRISWSNPHSSVCRISVEPRRDAKKERHCSGISDRRTVSKVFRKLPLQPKRTPQVCAKARKTSTSRGGSSQIRISSLCNLSARMPTQTFCRFDVGPNARAILWSRIYRPFERLKLSCGQSWEDPTYDIKERSSNSEHD